MPPALDDRGRYAICQAAALQFPELLRKWLEVADWVAALKAQQ